jgi:hypothetical protein
LVDDVDEPPLAGKMTQGTNDEPPSEERMSRIDDLDFVSIRVLEVGIKKWLLSTTCGMICC